MTINTINFIKLRNILWPLGSFPFQRELCLGPGTMQRFVSVKTEALDQPLMEAIYRVNMTEPTGVVSISQTQVPWRVERWCFRFRTPEVLSLLSEGFCCEISIRALAIAIPGRRGKRQVNVWSDIFGMATVVA